MKVLVTGGAGFIGSHVCRVLLEKWHRVSVVDNLSHGQKTAIPQGVNFFQADIADREEMVKILTGHEAVIHMASLIEVGESVKRPQEFAQNNIVGTVALLEAMKEANVKKIIFSSSACVYGRPHKLPITEDDPLGEQENPYGATKVCMEQFCALYHRLFGFDVVILRYFNPYGPGELHQPETHAIPNFIKAALNRQPLPVFWQGEQVRDFIYIEDLARAHVAPLECGGLHYYNIGTETGAKVKDVISMIADILGYQLEIADKGKRLGDVPELVASSVKIKKDLGWEAKVDLQEGLKRTIEYYRKQNP